MKRFLPLALLAAVWLIIALVPPLNLLFRVQAGGSSMAQFSAFPARKNVPNFWEKSAQRFPNDINVLWQAAGEYPESEEQKEEEEEDYSEEENLFGAPPGGYMPPTTGGRVLPQPTPDPTLPKSQTFPGQLEGLPADEKLRRLDLLIARFPNNTDLIAARLRAAISQMQNGRVGGEMSDSKRNENLAAGKPSPEKSEGPPNYTVADLNKAIALAQRGGKIEPDNGFFDWMRCYFLMHAWRDGEALQALDAAAAKKRFEDHSLTEQNSRMAAFATAFNRKLLLEEKLQIFSEGSIYPQYARYREMARILSWQSVKAQRRGDHKNCLRIIASLAQTAAKMRENSKTYIEGLVASAIEAIAWGGATYDARAGGQSRRTTANQRISSFQTYATKYGRSELAAEMGRNYTASAKYRTGVSANINNSNLLYGIPFWVFVLITILWVGGVLLLMLLPVSFLGAVLFRALSRIPRVRTLLRLEESSAEEIPSSREVWNGALACGGLRALGTAFCGAIIVALAFVSITIAVGEAETFFKSFAKYWDDTVGGGGFYTGLEGFYYLLVSTRAPESLKRWIVALSPLLFGLLFVAWRATEFQKARNGEHPFSTVAFFKSLFQGHAFRSPSGAREDLNVTAAVIKVADWLLMLLLIGSWYVLAVIPKSDTNTSWLIPVTCVILFSGAMLGEKIAIWRARPRRRQAVRYGLRLLNRSLWAWLVLGSTLYFVLLLVSLPLRSRAEQRLDRLIRLGEVRAAQTNTP